MNYLQFAVDNARQEFRAPVTSPRRVAGEAPSICCAAYAHVIETDGQRSIWRCPVCSRLWAVAR